MHRRTNLFALLAACLAVKAAPTAARTWRVPTDVPTVAAAIDSAAFGDVVEILAGVYSEHGLVLKSGLTLRGVDPPGAATIDAAGAGRIFIGISLEDVTLEGLALTGGAAANGGALNLASCRGVTIRGCSFVSNAAFPAVGGAIAASGGSSLAIEDCEFRDNASGLDDGGAIWLDADEVDVSRCAFGENSAVNGGAVSCGGSGVRVSECTFEANVAAANGGAVDVRAGAATVVDCLLVGNTAARGGGVVAWYDATPQIVGCTLAGNGATDRGGAVYCGGTDTVAIERSLIAGQTVGGAVACGAEADALLTCTDVTGNAGGDWTGCLAGQEFLAGNFSLDPVFCTGPDGPTWFLDAASPCLPENSPCGQLVGALGQGCADTAAPAAAASPVRLLGCRPNPFNPSTSIAFALDRSATLDLSVHDLSGRRVRVLAAGERFAAGRHERRWDGRDDRGRALAAGIYVYRLVSGSHEEIGTAVLLK